VRHGVQQRGRRGWRKELRPQAGERWQTDSAGRPGCGTLGPRPRVCLPRTSHWSRPPPAAAFTRAGGGEWGGAAHRGRSAADRTSVKSAPSGCETDSVRLCPVMGMLDGPERSSTSWEPQDRRAQSSTVKKAALYRRPPSSTPQAMLYGHM
jgi:hypothetical protein